MNDGTFTLTPVVVSAGLYWLLMDSPFMLGAASLISISTSSDNAADTITPSCVNKVTSQSSLRNFTASPSNSTFTSTWSYVLSCINTSSEPVWYRKLCGVSSSTAFSSLSEGDSRCDCFDPVRMFFSSTCTLPLCRA